MRNVLHLGNGEQQLCSFRHRRDRLEQKLKGRSHDIAVRELRQKGSRANAAQQHYRDRQKETESPGGQENTSSLNLEDGQEIEMERAAQIPGRDRLEPSSCYLISLMFWKIGACRYSLKPIKKLLPVGSNQEGPEYWLMSCVKRGKNI